MGILGNIFSKIFPSSHAANTTPAATEGTAPSASPTTTPPSGNPPPASAPQMTELDVEKMLDEKAAKSSQKLNWKSSIVDLMKLLDLDSSLAARKELAQELKYTGDMNDSATMNIWLHRQVMNKVAANGGKVPADLRD